jgi:anti-sigma factor RsiW
MTMAHLEDDELAGLIEGALDREDERAVATHLAACSDCGSRLREVRSLLALLPESVDEMVPRDRVKQGLLARASGDREQPQNVARPARRRRFGFVELPIYAVLAGVLAAAVTGALAANLLRSDPDTNSGLLEAITGTNRGIVLPMAGTEVAPGVRAALLAPQGAQRVYVVASNVPPPPAGQAYHLYLYENGSPVRAAVLEPDSRGRISAVLDAPLARFNAMEVDIQPVGTTTPGGPAVLKSNLP